MSVPTDFTAYAGGDDAYMGFTLDTSGAAPIYEGDCEGAASLFGVDTMGDWVDSFNWGYGFGPMTAAWDDDLADFLEDTWTEIGDTAGTSYLLWDGIDGLTVTTWGYFQVYGFDPGSSFIDFDADPTPGIRDRSTPADGYYDSVPAYVLSFGG